MWHKWTLTPFFRQEEGCQGFTQQAGGGVAYLIGGQAPAG
jgi:hypothetical protein